jgi:hypothetical protein
MTKDEALDLALEALLWANIEINDWRDSAYGYEPEDQPQIMEAITAIKQARSAPVQEPVAFNAGVPPLYPEMKDGETISVEYTTPPAAPVQEPDHGDELTIAYMSGVHRGKELARADEREACAKVAEWEPCMTDTPKRIAAAIRARGNT